VNAIADLRFQGLGKPERKPPAEIRIMKDDPVAVEASAEEINACTVAISACERIQSASDQPEGIGACDLTRRSRSRRVKSILPVAKIASLHNSEQADTSRR
jgi:hypothetical protein